MRATLMYGAGDVRVEDVPDPRIQHPTDAVVRVVRSCVCGSDLWPYASMPVSVEGRRMGLRAPGAEFVDEPDEAATLFDAPRDSPYAHLWRRVPEVRLGTDRAGARLVLLGDAPGPPAPDTAVRVIWTVDHLDAARRLQPSLVLAARRRRPGVGVTR